MNENKVQEARNRVFSAETELRKAREALDEELKPKYSPNMQKILKELGQYYKVEPRQDDIYYPLYSVLLKIDTDDTTGMVSNFRRLYKEGLFVGNVGRTYEGVILNFFTSELP